MRLAVIGGGAIGATHVQAILETEGFEIAGVADPFDGGAALAARSGTAHYRDHRALLEAERPDGAIIATPNETHVPIALDCLAAGVPVIVEKPIGNTVAEAETLLAAQAGSGLAVLVGHHRRHHPTLQKAKEIVDAGTLGRLVCVSASACMMKPDDYFAPAWRRTPGIGGTFLINLIHEIDLLRFLCGEIVSLAAYASSATRGLAVEDTGAITFEFADGALASFVVSDTAAGPWSWDLTAGDSPRFAVHDVNSHRFVGTHASVTLPRLEVWRHDGARDWTVPMTMTRAEAPHESPYARQIRHFRAVVEDGAPTRVGAIEGARNLAVMDAVWRSIETGRRADVATVAAR
ncbi:MAG: Gfo/Idh/MocA family oxidoreductase [Amaricoccus sp.]|uniref:Gfo/Idh/MocA family protein n=1 Tax=Amaricoccus sp. TaxID=1872485 RepID=UPI0039E4A1C5